MERDLPGLRRYGGVLGDPPNLTDLLHVLKSVPVAGRRVAHAAHRQDRNAGDLRSCDAAYGIGVPGTAGHDGNARLPGQSGPAIGHVHGRRLVAGVVDGDPVLRGRLQNVVEVITDQREDAIYALAAQAAYE